MTHYITKATMNATEALMGAMQLLMEPYEERGRVEGVQELVELINATSVKLRRVCQSYEYTIKERKRENK